MLIFLDVETTGLESVDKILCIAIIALSDEERELYDLVNEGKKIPSLASSINHITNEMIKDKPALNASETYQFLNQHNNSENTLIGHNVKFDIQKLNEAGFFWQGKVLDTLRVTKHLIPECEFYSLQFLRYELRLYKNEQSLITPHNALSDAKVVKNLYNYLEELSSLDEMILLSSKKVLLQKFEFGKYKGRFIEEIVMNDRNYVEWMLGNVTDMDEDLHYSLSHYLLEVH